MGEHKNHGFSGGIMYLLGTRTNLPRGSKASSKQ